MARTTLSDVKSVKLWRQFLIRFENPLIIILLIASGVSALTGGMASFVVIVVIVMLSVIFDFVQDVRAQKAVEALRASVSVQATVRRDGASISAPISQLVPGDIVELVAGDLVPADSRLLESRDLYVNQALLTGEPYPAEKRSATPLPARKIRRGHPTSYSPAPPSSAAPRPSWSAGPAAGRRSATSRPAWRRSRRPPTSPSEFVASAC